MDEQHQEDGNKKPRKKRTKKPPKAASKSAQETIADLLPGPDELLAAIDACLMRYRLALQEVELTIAFCRGQRAREAYIETLERFKGFIEDKARHMEKDRVPWATENLFILRAIWGMNEEAISNLPQEAGDVFRLVRQRSSQFNEDRDACLRLIESHNGMLKALTNVLWELRWQDEERAEFLLERLQNTETGPSRGDNLLFLAELLTRK